MQTRNYSAWTSWNIARRLPFAAVMALAAMTASGCGSSGGDGAPPTIQNTIITTNPTPITHVGGTATVTATVTDPSGIAPGSVMVNVVNQNGISLTGGPQTMTAPPAPNGLYTFQFNIPNNTAGVSNVTYTVTITAADTAGNVVTPSVTVGTITVPFPQGPPPPPV
jgi:hypothetical protein